MKKRFIILIDFSEYSGNLLRYAYDWSLQINAELLLVHQSIVVVPAFAGSEAKVRTTKETNDETLHKLKELANSILPSLDKASYSVSENQLQFTLPKLLAEPFEHLIFVGLKGTALIKKIFLGSVAIQVIDNTNNIVVAMPEEISKFSHEKIFVAVTERHPLNILQLNNFLNFLDEGTTSITFFNLVQPNEKTKEIEKHLNDLSKLFAERYKTTFAIYQGNNSFEEIKKVINNKINELLIVQKGSRLLTDQLFRKFLINE
ncbi:MAG TPA: universal stress protein, partial [Hanamia sp.]|nr:universal stress protein [Hanamia sp.]